MQQADIFVPFAGMMVLTLIVWSFMYIKRLSYLTKNAIDAQLVATPEMLNELLPASVNNPSNNLKNLFELPVLFYALCLMLFVTHSVDQLHLYCAHGYLLLRAAHSVIQCTFNKVMLRFIVYALSSILLWVMVVRAALPLLMP